MRLNKIILASSLLCSPQLAGAQNFNQLIGFGDSATDTGWFAHASTGIPLVDFWTASSLAAGGNAHFTGPGSGNAQILGGFFGLSANPANTPGGTNFAIGGAVDFLVPPGYPLPTATGNLFPNPLLPGTATQIGNYLASVGGHANPNGLYVLSSGGNDITAALLTFGAFSPAGVNYLLGEAQILSNSVAQLQAAGARYIIMSNYYPGPTTNPATFFYGNTILSATWSDLAAAGVKFIPADTFSRLHLCGKKPCGIRIHRSRELFCLHPACRLRRSWLGTDVRTNHDTQSKLWVSSVARSACRPTFSWMAFTSRKRASKSRPIISTTCSSRRARFRFWRKAPSRPLSG